MKILLNGSISMKLSLHLTKYSAGYMNLMKKNLYIVIIFSFMKKTGIAADGTPVFYIEKTEEDRIFVKYHSLRKASKWLTKPGTFAFNYTGEVSASDGA